MRANHSVKFRDEINQENKFFLFSLGAQVITQQRDVVERGIRFHIMIGAPLLLGIHGLRQQSVESKKKKKKINRSK
jgi:hypothetical protein